MPEGHPTDDELRERYLRDPVFHAFVDACFKERYRDDDGVRHDGPTIGAVSKAAAVYDFIIEAVVEPERAAHTATKAALAEAERRADRAALSSIEARNPGIDMDEVRRLGRFSGEFGESSE